ncbi:MAG: hypothetical protein ACYC7D_13500 [Nitrososphaerales archaeon]
MEKRPCTSPNRVEAKSPGHFIGALETHVWEVQNHQKLQGLGLIVRFRCSKCQLEWSNIVVEEEERTQQILRQQEESKNKKPTFEF